MMDNDNLINDLRRMSELNSMSLWKRDVCKRAADALSIPAVDAVEEKQGFWKVAGTGHPKQGNQRYRKQDQWTVYKCSNCGASNGRNRSDPYCRHCGARMLVDNCRYCYNSTRMDGQRREDGNNKQLFPFSSGYGIIVLGRSGQYINGG